MRRLASLDSHAAPPSVFAPEAGFLAVVWLPKVRLRRFASARHGNKGSLSCSSQQVEGMQRFCKTMARLLVFALLVLVFTQPTGATTAVMLLDTDLIVHSRFIVSGRVISLSTDRDGPRSMAWTYVEVGTDRVLKGDLHDGTIVLKQLGGTVGESGVRVIGQPAFVPGERVLLYLNTGADGSLHIAHSFMGKFSVIEDATGTEFVERSIDANDIDLLARTSPDEVTNRAPF